ncbi:MAG: DUF2007 domain-containing protein [Bacteroidota bacterium]
MENRRFDKWKTVFRTGLDYEAGLVRDRLRNEDIPAVILNKRDHAYNLTLGDMAQIKVMVPEEHEQQAKALLQEAPLSDEELEQAALSASPFDEDDEERDEDDD